MVGCGAASRKTERRSYFFFLGGSFSAIASPITEMTKHRNTSADGGIPPP